MLNKLLSLLPATLDIQQIDNRSHRSREIDAIDIYPDARIGVDCKVGLVYATDKSPR